jgi:4-amino-4-deoxy-L-arabinose transferase-like glycosyltransferase
LIVQLERKALVNKQIASSKLGNGLLLSSLFILALVVRLLYIKHSGEYYALTSDGLLYSNMAENFLHGKGLINTVRDKEYVVGPVYPYLLAALYYLFGLQNYTAVVFFQTIVSSVTAVLGFQLGRKLSGQVCASIVFASMCFYPPFLYWNRYILSETVYTFTITLFLITLLNYTQNAQKKRSLKYTVSLGLVLGLSILVRPILLPIFPVLLFWFFICNYRNWKKSLGDLALVGLIICLILAPWWVRNYARYHQFIAVTNYGGYELYSGNNPYTDTQHVFEPETYITFDPKIVDQVNKLPLAERDLEFSRLAKTYILEHPLFFVSRTLAKEINVFWAPLSGKDSIYLGLGALGAVTSLLFFRRTGFLLLVTAYYSLVISAITVVPTARYRSPIMPAVIILGSLFLDRMFQFLKTFFKAL